MRHSATKGWGAASHGRFGRGGAQRANERRARKSSGTVGLAPSCRRTCGAVCEVCGWVLVSAVGNSAVAVSPPCLPLARLEPRGTGVPSGRTINVLPKRNTPILAQRSPTVPAVTCACLQSARARRKHSPHAATWAYSRCLRLKAVVRMRS